MAFLTQYFKTNIYMNSISGIWNSLGCIPDKDNNLTFYLEENAEGSDSLIQLCGFDTDIRKIGLLASNKQISELIVMLPMAEMPTEYGAVPSERVVVEEKDNCLPCEENANPCLEWEEPASNDEIKSLPGYENLVYCKTEDAWLFIINQQEIITSIEKIILNFEENGRPISRKTPDEIKTILDSMYLSGEIKQNNTIYKQLYSMVTHNIPPHLNWVQNKDIPMYMFYTAEFFHTLTKGDLSNIWQGSMPKIATIPEEQEIEIEHELNLDEMFGGYDIANIEDIKLKVFKCKKRAHNDYFKDLVKDTVTNRLNKEWYQYNWPYDYFSLVELLKIEGWEVRDYSFEKPEPPPYVRTTTNRS